MTPAGGESLVPGARFVDPSVLARIGNLELVARAVDDGARHELQVADTRKDAGIDETRTRYEAFSSGRGHLLDHYIPDFGAGTDSSSLSTMASDEMPSDC